MSANKLEKTQMVWIWVLVLPILGVLVLPIFSEI